jgi:hypothetical protein
MTQYLALIIVAVLAISCASHTKQIELERAERMASQLHEGMTYEQVSRLIPLTQRNRVPTLVHGGVWYDVPVGKEYYIQMRFEHLKDEASYSQTKLNLPVRVKRVDRRTVLPSQ